MSVCYVFLAQERTWQGYFGDLSTRESRYSLSPDYANATPARYLPIGRVDRRKSASSLDWDARNFVGKALFEVDVNANVLFRMARVRERERVSTKDVFPVALIADFHFSFRTPYDRA